MQYNTLDIDTNNKEDLMRILNKICDCEFLQKLTFDFSLQKGVHLKMFCDKEKCEICRLVFDDQRRMGFDCYRPIFSRNVMFDEKDFFHRGEKIR